MELIKQIIYQILNFFPTAMDVMVIVTISHHLEFSFLIIVFPVFPAFSE